MIFNVPQFIDIEDKIVGPLTAKQLGWLAAGSVVLLFLYGLFDKSTFILLGIIDAIFFGALAFYRPYSQPLIKFIMSSILFATRPKMYIWRRIPEKIQSRVEKKSKNTQVTTKKEFNAQKVADISRLLDMKK
jgi:hypothetical protein